MLSFIVPGSIRKVADQYKDLFSDCGIGFSMLCALLCYFLFGAKSFSALVRMCPWAPSVSSLSRAAARFRPNRAMRRLRERVLKKYSHINNNDFCFAVD